MVLTTPNDAFIGKPTMVNAVPIVQTPLTTQKVLAPVDECSLFYAFFNFRCLFSIFFFKIRNVLIIFSDHLNVETFLTHRWHSRQLRVKIFGHIYIYL